MTEDLRNFCNNTVITRRARFFVAWEHFDRQKRLGYSYVTKTKI